VSKISFNYLSDFLIEKNGGIRLNIQNISRRTSCYFWHEKIKQFFWIFLLNL